MNIWVVIFSVIGLVGLAVFTVKANKFSRKQWESMTDEEKQKFHDDMQIW